MAILTTSGRTALTQALKDKPIHLAWGTGDSLWDVDAVPERIDATSLVAEVGRRKATVVQYAIPNADGAIVVPNGRFDISATPTNHLYCQFDFDYVDAPSASVREIAVFSGTLTLSGLPGGQMYFLPEELENPGTLVVLEHVPKLTRSANVQQAFKFVITV